MTVASVALAVIHIARPHAAIDGTTVALLGIAALPWLGSIFDTIELPGGLKGEYRQRLAVMEQRVADVESELANIRGATPALADRLREALRLYVTFLTDLGLHVDGPIPDVDVTQAPAGMYAA